MKDAEKKLVILEKIKTSIVQVIVRDYWRAWMFFPISNEILPWLTIVLPNLFH